MTTRGDPRVQYRRTYFLLPPGAGSEWANAIIDALWDTHRPTIGGSADDAGIGDLDDRRVVAVNPDMWNGDLMAFFAEYYPGPGIVILPIYADTPEELVAFLKNTAVLKEDWGDYWR